MSMIRYEICIDLYGSFLGKVPLLLTCLTVFGIQVAASTDALFKSEKGQDKRRCGGCAREF